MRFCVAFVAVLVLAEATIFVDSPKNGTILKLNDVIDLRVRCDVQGATLRVYINHVPTPNNQRIHVGESSPYTKSHEIYVEAVMPMIGVVDSEVSWFYTSDDSVVEWGKNEKRLSTLVPYEVWKTSDVVSWLLNQVGLPQNAVKTMVEHFDGVGQVLDGKFLSQLTGLHFSAMNVPETAVSRLLSAIEDLIHPGKVSDRPLPFGKRRFFSSEYHPRVPVLFNEACKLFGIEYESRCMNSVVGEWSKSHLYFRTSADELGFQHCSAEVGPHMFRQLTYHQRRKQLSAFDAFTCSFPLSTCELFMPFGKPMLLWVITQVELGRESPPRFQEWMDNLRLIAERPNNVVGCCGSFLCNNARYWAGLPEIELAPLCPVHGQDLFDAAIHAYAPSRPEVIVFGIKMRLDGSRNESAQHIIGRFIIEASALLNAKTKIVTPYMLYGHWNYADITAHPAVVFCPYNHYTLLFDEMYALNIPIFFPARELLCQWAVDFDMLEGAITWHEIPSLERDPPPDLPSWWYWFHNTTAMCEWVGYHQAYDFPHVQYFSSINDLYHRLENTDLAAVSKSMKEYNAVEHPRRRKHWETAFAKMFDTPPEVYPVTTAVDGSEERRVLNTSEVEVLADGLAADFNDALEMAYGQRLSFEPEDETFCYRETRQEYCMHDFPVREILVELPLHVGSELRTLSKVATLRPNKRSCGE